jgi:hypothetical protein
VPGQTPSETTLRQNVARRSLPEAVFGGLITLERRCACTAVKVACRSTAAPAVVTTASQLCALGLPVELVAPDIGRPGQHVM